MYIENGKNTLKQERILDVMEMLQRDAMVRRKHIDPVKNNFTPHVKIQQRNRKITLK